MSATTLRIRACTTCGAVTVVQDGAEGGVDNEEAHRAWHAGRSLGGRMRRLLRCS